MSHLHVGWQDRTVRAWQRHRRWLLWLIAALLAAITVVWMGYQLWRLLIGEAPWWPSSPAGAIDLRVFRKLSRDWFAGENVYLQSSFIATYPPASHPMLWLLSAAWLPLTWARWWYALAAAGALVWFTRTLLAESHPADKAECTVVALLPFACYATGATLGNGQLAVLLLPALMGAIFLLARNAASTRLDIAASLLITIGLAKPSLGAPLAVLALIVAWRWRPALLAGGAYLALSLTASLAQPTSHTTLIAQWLQVSTRAAVTIESADLHNWLGFLGLDPWIAPASLLLLAALAVWLVRHRKSDLWLLLGVTAIVARLWAHHAWYDDMLLILPVIALWRDVRTFRQTRQQLLVAALIAALFLSIMAPGGRYLLPDPWRSAYITGQVLVWLAALIYLGWRASRKRV